MTNHENSQRDINAKSDDLPGLLETARRMRLPSKLPLVLQPYHAVVDANHVIAAIRFKARRVEAPRAHFEELVAANALIVYAPTALAATVPRKLAAIAEKQRLPLDRMLWLWDQMKPCIHFVEPSCDEDPRWTKLRQRDPEDVPYCQLVEDIGADFILTGDNDFKDAPISVVSPLKARVALLALKLYVRARARELQSKSATAGTAMLGMHATLGLSRAVLRGPWWVQLAAFAAGVLLLLNRDLRSRVGNAVQVIASSVAGTFGEMLTTSVIAEKEAGEHLELTLRELCRRKPTMLQATARIMIHQGEGWRLGDLEGALREGGHVTEPVGRARWLLRNELAASSLFEQDATERTWWFRSPT